MIFVLIATWPLLTAIGIGLLSFSDVNQFVWPFVSGTSVVWCTSHWLSARLVTWPTIIGYHFLNFLRRLAVWFFLEYLWFLISLQYLCLKADFYSGIPSSCELSSLSTLGASSKQVRSVHLRVFWEVFLAFLENLRQFHRLVPIASLPALGISRLFSHAWHQSPVFPRLAPVACFPALGTSRLFSRAWQSLHAVSSSSDYFIAIDLIGRRTFLCSNQHQTTPASFSKAVQ